MTSAHVSWLGMLVAASVDGWSRETITAIYLHKWFGRVRVRPAVVTTS